MVIEVVKPEIVKVEEAPQVANGIAGAPVVAPLTFNADPFSKTNVAAEPVRLPLAAATELFTIPVLLTVTTVPVPPVVVSAFAVLPPMFKVPEILPVIPVPVVKTIAAAFVTLFKLKELPDRILSSSPIDPVKVKVLVVVDED